jgi:hypothetical protein
MTLSIIALRIMTQNNEIHIKPVGFQHNYTQHTGTLYSQYIDVYRIDLQRSKTNITPLVIMILRKMILSIMTLIKMMCSLTLIYNNNTSSFE